MAQDPVPDAVVRWKPEILKWKSAWVEPQLVMAIVWKESTGNQWAYNPEPRYPYLVNVNTRAPYRKQTTAELASEYPPMDWPGMPGSDPDAEWWGQQASWGAMQVMGAAARERGFRGMFLTELCDPDINLQFGVSHLWMYAYNQGRVSKVQALQRWNGGGDPNYANDVIEKQTAIERAQIFS